MSRTRQERFRIGLVFAVLCLFFAAFVVRLAHLQIFCASRYGDIVSRQSSGQIDIPAARGIICDRNGRIVANNVVRSTLYAWPSNRAELRQVSAYLEKLFGLKKGTAAKQYGLEVRKFSYIKRNMSDDLARTVEKNAPRGLYLRESSNRAYPYGLVGKQILGFTDIDNVGQAGLELKYDSMLAGRAGMADIYRDGHRNTFRVKETALINPVAGTSLVLAADWRLQEIVEEELKTTVETCNAQSAMAVFVDCRTGDILAMAHYDPREKHVDKPVKLRTVSDQFEPGSVFKVVTAAAILDKGSVDFDDSVYCEHGLWKMGRRSLRDDHIHDSLTFRQIIEFSSNIGVAKLAIAHLGGQSLYDKAADFGIGRRIDIGLPGETGGAVARPNRWSENTTAQLAMGHAVAVNAVQMAMVFAAVANGGDLLKPRLMLGHLDENHALKAETEPTVIKRVMKRSSADSLQGFLAGVVDHGTATPVKSEIVSIAGKTGTAQMPDLERGTYFQHRFTASFGGYFPVENPSVAGIVVVVDPQPMHYGGYTAGPAFRAIAERYSVLNPERFINADQMLAQESNGFDQTIEVPDFVGHGWEYACNLAEEAGVKVRGNVRKGTVTWQFPPAGRLMFRGDDVVLAVSAGETTPMTMADLCGLSMRKAAAFLNFTGVTFRVAGSGTVVKQSIQAGESISGKSFCQLECRQKQEGGSH